MGHLARRGPVHRGPGGTLGRDGDRGRVSRRRPSCGSSGASRSRQRRGICWAVRRCPTSVRSTSTRSRPVSRRPRTPRSRRASKSSSGSWRCGRQSGSPRSTRAPARPRTRARAASVSARRRPRRPDVTYEPGRCARGPVAITMPLRTELLPNRPRAPSCRRRDPRGVSRRSRIAPTACARTVRSVTWRSHNHNSVRYSTQGNHSCRCPAGRRGHARGRQTTQR